jgi:hypothetical protein
MNRDKYIRFVEQKTVPEMKKLLSHLDISFGTGVRKADLVNNFSDWVNDGNLPENLGGGWDEKFETWWEAQ